MPANPYVGEIMSWGGNFAPAGWLFCDGSLLPIAQYETLFNLIGTTYGGDGQNTFALPDLRGRIPIHAGSGPGLSTHVLGEKAGAENVTLTANQIPAHAHTLLQNPTGDSPVGDARIPAPSRAADFSYGPTTTSSSTPASAGMISNAGGNQPHANTQPFLCINYVISPFGVFPSP